MTQYIEKAAVVAEIEKLQLSTMDEYMNYYTQEAQGEYNALVKLETFLDTLEVKEVDLGKEYDNEFFKDPVFGKLVNRNAGISIARHFFGLGLKARKEE